jgi:hypothetical protein
MSRHSRAVNLARTPGTRVNKFCASDRPVRLRASGCRSGSQRLTGESGASRGATEPAASPSSRLRPCRATGGEGSRFGERPCVGVRGGASAARGGPHSHGWRCAAEGLPRMHAHARDWHPSRMPARLICCCCAHGPAVHSAHLQHEHAQLRQAGQQCQADGCVAGDVQVAQAGHARGGQPRRQALQQRVAAQLEARQGREAAPGLRDGVHANSPLARAVFLPRDDQRVQLVGWERRHGGRGGSGAGAQGRVRA